MAKRASKKAPAKKAPSKRAPSKKTPGKAGDAAGTRAEAGSGPRLLSGGNPQIAKGDGEGPVRAYIDAMPGWKGEVGERLDALIVRTVPNVSKAVRWNSPFYGIEGQGWFLSFHCITRYVKVAFFRGTSLCPPPPVESKNEGTRYLHIHEGDWGGVLDEKLLVSWKATGAV